MAARREQEKMSRESRKAHGSVIGKKPVAEGAAEGEGAPAVERSVSRATLKRRNSQEAEAAAAYAVIAAGGNEKAAEAAAKAVADAMEAAEPTPAAEAAATTTTPAVEVSPEVVAEPVVDGNAATVAA